MSENPIVLVPNESLEFERQLTLAQLQDALAKHLPRRPGWKTMKNSVANGMPFIQPPGAKTKKYLLSACLPWWYATHTSPTPTTTAASDAAIRASRFKRRA